MKRSILFLFLGACALFGLGAQEAQEPSQPSATYDYQPIRKGDQTIRINLGTGLSLFNATSDEIETETNMKAGGSGNIGFTRFVTNRVFLGGEIAFAFNPTIGGNLYFYLPLTFLAGYELVFDRIHVPLSVAMGGVFQTYSTTNYFGPILRPELGVYWQYSPAWSFGAQSGWNIIPQWYADGWNNRTGNILTLSAGFRYHFY